MPKVKTRIYFKKLKLITQIIGLTKDQTWLNGDVEN